MRGKLGCIFAAAAIFLALSGLASNARAQVEQLSAARFDLPSQPLADALRAVGRQANVNVLFDPPLVARLTAPPLKAQLTLDQALSRLLAGTGLKHVFLNERTVVLESTQSKKHQTSIQGGCIMAGRVSPCSSTTSSLLLASVALGATATGAVEQARAQTTSESTGGVSQQLEGVIVYSQKRGAGERVQDVPIAITALGSLALERNKTLSIADLGRLAPGVQTQAVGTTPGFQNISIRGIGQNGSLRALDPPVSIIQDGMVFAYAAASMASTFDLESVEILRGPQGVLFGRNATAGAVSLRTRRPTADFQIRGELTAGSFNEFASNFSAEGALGSDSVRGKLAVMYRSNDGYMRNTNKGAFVPAPGNPSGAAIVHSTGRLPEFRQVIVKPTVAFDLFEDTTLTLLGQYQTIDGNATTSRLFRPGAPAAVSFLETVYGFTPQAGKYETNNLLPTRYDLDAYHVIAELKSGGLNTVAAYRKVDILATSDLLGSPFLLSYSPDNPESNEQFSIEPRYNMTLTSTLDLSVGLFGLDSKTHHLELRQGSGPASAPTAITYARTEFKQDAKAYAAYANLDYRFTDRLELSVGGRYSRETKEASIAPTAPCTVNFASCSATFVDGKKTWTDFSPRVVLNFEPVDDIHLYASYTEGFRSGSFNSRPSSAAAIGPADPESVAAYEIGMKTEFFERALRFNAAAFTQEYEDIQQVQTIPGTIVQTLLNAAKARGNGLEFDLNWRPVDAFELEANLSLLDTKYLEFDVPLAPLPGGKQGTDLEIPRVPSTTAFVAANLYFSIGALPGEFSLRGSYETRSSFYADFQNTPALEMGEYDLFDASLSYKQRNWSASMFVKNLTNEDYSDNGAFASAYARFGGQPRTVGIRVSFEL